jgi:hypothetical protein
MMNWRGFGRKRRYTGIFLGRIYERKEDMLSEYLTSLLRFGAPAEYKSTG